MNIMQVIRIAVVTVLVALLWILGDPALAVVAGIISVGVLVLLAFAPSHVGSRPFGPIAKT